MRLRDIHDDDMIERVRCIFNERTTYHEVQSKARRHTMRVYQDMGAVQRRQWDVIKCGWNIIAMENQKKRIK